MAAKVTQSLFLAAALGGALLAGPAMAGGCYGSGCYRYATTPPVYDTIHRNVLVRPPRTVYRTIPPVYDTVEERVLVAPAGRFWQTSRGPGGELIGCWVETPPRFALRRRTVLVRPAETVPETIPPQYASVSRRVLVAPARAGWVPAGGYGYGVGHGGPLVGSIPDAFGITGASSADVAVGLGFSRGSIYDGY
jgi:hypothetical protein